MKSNIRIYLVFQIVLPLMILNFCTSCDSGKSDRRKNQEAIIIKMSEKVDSINTFYDFSQRLDISIKVSDKVKKKFLRNAYYRPAYASSLMAPFSSNFSEDVLRPKQYYDFLYIYNGTIRYEDLYLINTSNQSYPAAPNGNEHSDAYTMKIDSLSSIINEYRNYMSLINRTLYYYFKLTIKNGHSATNEENFLKGLKYVTLDNKENVFKRFYGPLSLHYNNNIDTKKFNIWYESIRLNYERFQITYRDSIINLEQYETRLNELEAY